MKGQFNKILLSLSLVAFVACGENPMGKDFRAITQEIDLQNFKGKFSLLDVPGRNASDLIDLENLEEGEYLIKKVIAAVSSDPDGEKGSMTALLEQDLKTPGKLQDSDKLNYKVQSKSNIPQKSNLKLTAHVELSEIYVVKSKQLSPKSEVTLLQSMQSDETSKTAIAQKGTKAKDKITVATFLKQGKKISRGVYKLRSSELRITSLEKGFSLWLLNMVGKNKTAVRLDYNLKPKEEVAATLPDTEKKEELETKKVDPPSDQETTDQPPDPLDLDAETDLEDTDEPAETKSVSNGGDSATVEKDGAKDVEASEAPIDDFDGFDEY